MAPKASTSKEKDKGKESPAPPPPKKKAKTNGVEVKPAKSKAPTKAAVKALGTLEKRIYEAALERPDLVTTTQLQKDIGMEDAAEMLKHINTLMKKGLVGVSTGGSNNTTTWVKAIPIATAKIHSALDDEVRLVLTTIVDANDTGIWKRTLKTRTSIHEQTLTKCLRELEGRKLIKAVKSVKYPTRRYYMGFDITPSVELTGGPWYRDDRELDSEFIDALLKLSDLYIEKMTCTDGKRSSGSLLPRQHWPYFPTLQGVRDHVVQTKILKELHLSDANYRDLLDILVAQRKIEPYPIIRHSRDAWGQAPKLTNGHTKINGKSKKRALVNDYDSDEIDEDDSEEDESDMDAPSPAVAMDVDAPSDVPRVGPAGHHDFTVYRTCFNSERDRPSPPIHVSGVSDGPCGACPVREVCNNSGRPRYRETGGIVVRPLPPKPLGLVIPSASDQGETVDDIWRGGGRKGAEATRGLVSPEECVYFDRWHDFVGHMPSEREVEGWRRRNEYERNPFDW